VDYRFEQPMPSPFVVLLAWDESERVLWDGTAMGRHAGRPLRRFNYPCIVPPREKTRMRAKKWKQYEDEDEDSILVRG
jgi:hypothetical protein